MSASDRSPAAHTTPRERTSSGSSEHGAKNYREYTLARNELARLDHAALAR